MNFRSNNYHFIDSLRLRYDEKQLRELQDISSKLKLAFIKRAEQADKVAASIRHSLILLLYAVILMIRRFPMPIIP